MPSRAADEEGARRCALASAACRALGEVSAEHIHDVILKTLVVGMEAADCSSFGPFANVEPNGELGCQETLLRGLSSDLDWVSPLPALFNELSVRAWDLSGSTSAFSQPIGSAVTSAFSFARGLDSVERETRPVPTKLPAGYNRFMGGPFIQWQRAYETYQDIKTDADRFYKDFVLPAHERFEAVRQKWPTNYDFSNDPAAEQEVKAADYVEIEEYGNGLWDQLHDVKMRLYLTPAPSSAELATKLKLYSENRDGDLIRSNEIVEQMMYDARRFGRHGAHLQTDATLLSAFAARRRDFEATEGVDLAGDQEDAYFARVDAAEAVLIGNRATTIEGVLAKLRVAFLHQTGEDWSDLAISNTKLSKFTEGLALSDMYTRLAWAAIEDLARIAGVSLAEQGA